MPLPTFTGEDIQTLLEAVDRHLTARAKVTLVGGGAASLAYGISSTTEDLDTLNALTAALHAAIDEARQETGLNIPFAPAGVVKVPTECEGRLERLLPELQKLEVWALEKHDLALSKATRCTEDDLQQIREIHDSVGLDFEVLVQRFREEVWGYVVGDPNTQRDYFLWMIEDLFGEQKKIDARSILGNRKA